MCIIYAYARIHTHTHTHCAYTQGHILYWHQFCLSNTFFSVQIFNTSGSIKIKKIALKEKKNQSFLIKKSIKKLKGWCQNRRNKLKWTEFKTSAALRTVWKFQRWRMQNKKKHMTNQCCFLCLLSSVLSFRVLLEKYPITKAVHLRRLQGSLLPDPRHMIREIGGEFTAPSLLHACLSVSLFVSTVVQSNYTHAYLHATSLFLVFVSVKKILHLYLQQLNRGQLSTCVVTGNEIWC